MQISGSVEKMSILLVFYISWDILDKRKGNLGQECVNRGLLFFQDKKGIIALDFPGK